MNKCESDLALDVGGNPHPKFCEWLMGFDADWTRLDDESPPLETPSSLNAPKSSVG